MTLVDLWIYGDWLEENDIKNNLYKQFINYLRIKLRKNDDYDGYNDPIENGNGYGGGFFCGYRFIGGNGIGIQLDGDHYGGGFGNGYRCFTGKGGGIGYSEEGDEYGNGYSI